MLLPEKDLSHPFHQQRMEVDGDASAPGTKGDSWIQLASPEYVASKLLPIEAFSDAKKIHKVLLQTKSS